MHLSQKQPISKSVADWPRFETSACKMLSNAGQKLFLDSCDALRRGAVRQQSALERKAGNRALGSLHARSFGPSVILRVGCRRAGILSRKEKRRFLKVIQARLLLSFASNSRIENTLGIGPGRQFNRPGRSLIAPVIRSSEPLLPRRPFRICSAAATACSTAAARTSVTA